jgi:hypothetical protein
MATSKLTTLAEQKKELGHKTMSKNAILWLQEKIKELKKPEIAKIASNIKSETDRNAKRFRLGMLYCFFYDPKTKADMPYWDKFPMVLVLEKYNDGFLGLNLHYLPPKYRIAFMSKLMKYALLNDEDDIMRMKISYDILQASKRYVEFKPCLKRYLNSQIRSRMLTIKPSEWDVAIQLPLQQFKGAKDVKVWKDSVQEWKEHMSHFNQDQE